jgi:hypothetical protein
MKEAEFISHSRMSFAMLRWAPLVAAAALPFTFGSGHAPILLLVTAIPIAALWLAFLLLAWRTRNQLWLILSFPVLMGCPRLVGLHNPDLPLSHAIQWLCIVIVVAGAPLLLFRSRLLQLTRLDVSPLPNGKTDL